MTTRCYSSALRAPPVGDSTLQVLLGGQAPSDPKGAFPDSLSQFDSGLGVRLLLMEWASGRAVDGDPSAQPVAGVWWPRSADLAAEIVPLLAALSRRLGRRQVSRVLYDHRGWLPAPHMLPIGRDLVEGQWLTGVDLPQITLVLRDGTWIVLRVIPWSHSKTEAIRTLGKALELGARLPDSGNPRRSLPSARGDGTRPWFGTGGPPARP